MKALIFAFSIIAMLLIVSTAASAEEHNSGSWTPALWQAFGSVAAIFLAIFVGYWQFRQSHGLAKAQQDHEQAIRRLRANSLAHALYPDLIEVRVMIKASKAKIDREVEQRNPLRSPNFTTQGWKINIPVVLETSGEMFYLLGTDAAPIVSQLLSLLHSHNRAASTLIEELNDGRTSANAWQKLHDEELFNNRFRLLHEDIEEVINLIGRIRDKELLPEYALEVTPTH